jgi:uncharacterized protein (TIGR03437 family)
MVIFSSPPAPIFPVQILIGNVVAEIQYVGQAPGEVAGLMQINAQVPLTVSSGQQSVLLRIGNAISQDGVFLTVA